MEEEFNYLDEILNAFHEEKLMSVFHLIQKNEGHLSKNALMYVSKKVKIPLAKLYSASSFYAYFRFKKKGKSTIQICRCLSCHLGGAEEIVQALEEFTGLKPGESSEKWSIESVQCIGLCDKGPAMLLDGYPQTHLTREKLKTLLETCTS